MTTEYGLCAGCGTPIARDYRSWLHVGTGNYRCPPGQDGYAAPQPATDVDELREALRQEIYAEMQEG